MWWVALWWYRRRHAWLRAPVLAVGLVIATAFADASVVIAAGRMSEPGGQALASALLWIASFFSLTTYMVLRAPATGGGGGDDGGGGGSDPPDDPGEPPWWPDFERDFREYARRAPRPHRGPRAPAGTR